MNAPKKKPPNLRDALRRDAVKGAVPNLPRLMYRGTLNALLDKCDWATGRNIFISKATIGKGWTGGSERKITYDLRYLEAGGWISKQAVKGPDGYEPVVDEHAREAYYGTVDADGKQVGGIRADRRPTIYRINFPVFYAEPRPLTGCKNDPPSADATGCKNDTPRGCKIRRHGVQTAAPNHSMTSDPSDLRSTDSSILEESPEKPNPPTATAGGLGSSGPTSDSPCAAEENDATAWRAPTMTERFRTVRAALKILKYTRDEIHALSRSEKFYAIESALEKITESGTPCLYCACLVPWWVIHGVDDSGSTPHDVLAGMNQREELTHLWGRDFHGYMAKAQKFCREHDLWEDVDGLSETELYDNARTLPEIDASIDECRWCQAKSSRRRWRPAVHPNPGEHPAA